MTIGRASRLQGLEAFVETVDAGSFAGAAQRLGVTRSAVAKSVARLERHLGVSLLARSRRAVQLTPEGQVFYENAVRALGELDDAENRLSARRTTVTGELVVSVPVSLGRRWLAPILLEFCQAHPDVRLSLQFTDRFVRLYEEGIDLAIRIGAASEPGELISRTLAYQESFVCASPAYLERYGQPHTLDDLKSHACVNFARDGRITPWRLKDRDGEYRDFVPPGPHSISHGEAMLDAVTAGHGIANLPDWLAGQALRDGALVRVLPDIEIACLPIRALWPDQRAQFPRVRLAIDRLIEVVSPRPPWAVWGLESSLPAY